MIPTQQSPQMYVESLQIPLKEIPWADVKKKILDPVTKKPYKGIVLEGPFADLSNTDPNNNKRYYTEPEYLEMLNYLKKQIHSPKGVYGELEHPQGYNINPNNASHKILDVWYIPETKIVMGRIILLNTEKGKIAQEVIRSGGQLGISARAAGNEFKNPDGTTSCKLKLLTTYDLVYHPGFSISILEFKELNESQKFIQDISDNKIGFSGFIPVKNFGSINKLYEKYTSLNENNKYCFFEWYFKNLNEGNVEFIKLYESKDDSKKEKIQEDKLQKNKASDEDDIENQLSSATDNDLSESKNDFFGQISKSQRKLKKQSKSVYDNSAGFIDGDFAI